MMGMMLLEHVIACGWFGIGSMDSENGMTWITTSKLNEAPWIKDGTVMILEVSWDFPCHDIHDTIHSMFFSVVCQGIFLQAVHGQFDPHLIWIYLNDERSPNFTQVDEPFLQFVDVPWSSDKKNRVLHLKNESCEDF